MHMGIYVFTCTGHIEDLFFDGKLNFSRTLTLSSFFLKILINIIIGETKIINVKII